MSCAEGGQLCAQSVQRSLGVAFAQQVDRDCQQCLLQSLVPFDAVELEAEPFKSGPLIDATLRTFFFDLVKKPGAHVGGYVLVPGQCRALFEPFYLLIIESDW